jgi:hypothetical protein
MMLFNGAGLEFWSGSLLLPVLWLMKFFVAWEFSLNLDDYLNEAAPMR